MDMIEMAGNRQEIQNDPPVSGVAPGVAECG